MWIFTTIGFFSVVQKRDTDFLTVRARVASDLNNLRNKFMPQLSPTVAGAGTDYPFRATISHEDFGVGLARMGEAIKYDNFKSAIGQQMGWKREEIYHRVWNVLADLEETQKDSTMQKAYGGVVINDQGKVLIREPKGHYDGYVWTFAKGIPEKGESPEQTALREVIEESGIAAEILVKIPGSFLGSTTDNEYFLMRSLQDRGNFGNETQAVRWVTQREAEALIQETKNKAGRERDCLVLKAAFAEWNKLTVVPNPHSPSPLIFDEKGRALKTATRKDWKVKRLPARRTKLLIDRTFSSAEMDLVKRGFIPKEMEQKWFIFFERNRLYIIAVGQAFASTLFNLRSEMAAGPLRRPK
jgi:8-oxo-dGTP pyrophosphatase MutT (NUDIX family)